MKIKYEQRLNQKLELITDKTLVVGIDIAKGVHWARTVDYRGIEIGKAIHFFNNKQGFDNIVSTIHERCKQNDYEKVIVGMEPTGHYWKPLANYLHKQEDMTVVLVNPYATKMSKELDDNSPTKSDKKDSLTIARLVKDGRYFETYLPHDVYADLRVMSSTRQSLNKRKNALKNTIVAVMDEYFPEFITVFKHPLKGKAARHILKTCPFPRFILEKSEDELTNEIKSAVKKTVGRKHAQKLIAAAHVSIGVDYGEEAARFKLLSLMEGLDLVDYQIERLEANMASTLEEIGYTKYLLSIKGFGVVTLATLLGELGDPKRFEDPRQMSRMAGYNLKEDSSGKNQSGTCISKRGRKNLRSVLYQIALNMTATNPEMRELYKYLKTRKNNPLKKMQAMVVISKKILVLVHALVKKEEYYNAGKVFGVVRREQLKMAA
ncbi:MAG: IS110 family transposase [Lentihominibacter sp.]|jgi:transposase